MPHRTGLLLFTTLAAHAAPDFEREVAPILESRCLSCHDAANAKGDVRLDTPTAVLEHLKPGHPAPACSSSKSAAPSPTCRKGKTPHPRAGRNPPPMGASRRPLARGTRARRQTGARSRLVEPAGNSKFEIRSSKRQPGGFFHQGQALRKGPHSVPRPTPPPSYAASATISPAFHRALTISNFEFRAEQSETDSRRLPEGKQSVSISILTPSWTAF